MPRLVPDVYLCGCWHCLCFPTASLHHRCAVLIPGSVLISGSPFVIALDVANWLPPPSRLITCAAFSCSLALRFDDSTTCRVRSMFYRTFVIPLARKPTGHLKGHGRPPRKVPQAMNTVYHRKIGNALSGRCCKWCGTSGVGSRPCLSLFFAIHVGI